jgi:hypothetical protein
MTGVTTKPAHPVGDFSKANWGDHDMYNTDSSLTSVYPTSTLINLISQLKPWQWEKILATATEDSKNSLSSNVTVG